jgi:16S rRNA processing protein RimM
MSDLESKYIVIGKIGATYGIKGWLKIHTYTESGASILDYSPWYLPQSKDSWLEVTIEDGKPHGKTIIAKIKGFDNPEDARKLTSKEIYIKRSQLPELKKDEYYWSDLEGLSVFTKDGLNLGKVIYLIETGANDVLVVKGEREHAIPYLPGKVVLNIDLEKQEILVDWEPL